MDLQAIKEKKALSKNLKTDSVDAYITLKIPILIKIILRFLLSNEVFSQLKGGSVALIT